MASQNDLSRVPEADAREQDTLPDPNGSEVREPSRSPAEPRWEMTAPVTVKLERRRRRRRKSDLPPEGEEPSGSSEQTPDPSSDQDAPTDHQEHPPEPLGDTMDAAPESMPISRPASWERYEILRLLGRGGMGAVYEARDRKLDRKVALKFIHSANPVTTKRFLQEARAQARIDHPNVCKVLEVGEVEGKAYIAMQLIEGTSLSQAARSMSIDEKAHLMKLVSDAVGAAHRLGIIHRDIKPGNIMVEVAPRSDEADAPGDSERPPLRPVLMDFGLAREAGDTKGLTESGAVMGTPAYMSPEQARGDTRKLDARSDIYSLGATFYDILAGAPPFADESAVNILLKVLVQDPIRLRVKVPAVPQALETIVEKCMQKEPRHRYATAGELSADLDRFLSNERVLAKRLSLPTRLYWRARRNKSMAFAVVGLIVTLLAFTGYGVRTVIVDARNEALARRRAELGQTLGQAVKDLEWLVRSAYLVPLHDTGPEKAKVRAKMAEIEAEMRGFGEQAAGLDHYALGRGYVALGEWDPARLELSQAETQGVREPELHYALGRVYGELYSRAIDDARRSGDKTYFQRRKAELDQELLEPALSYLERCRGLGSVPADYLEGLIHFYHGRHHDALSSARRASAKITWLYEAEELQGDVFMTLALDAKDGGDNDLADRDFARAVAHYEAAANIGRSDHKLYEALAEAWIRQQEMDLFRGRDPAPKLAQALAAADKALVAAPKESRGHAKKAFAYYFQARYAEGHGAKWEGVEELFRKQIAAGKEAIGAHPADAYAHEITAIAHIRLAARASDMGQPAEAQPLLDLAYAHLEEAIRLNPRFPWAYNDYGTALGYAGVSKRGRNEDPRALFERAIELTQKATVLDEQYFMGYNNTAVWMIELAQWKADHGQIADDMLEEAVRVAERAIRINKQNPLAHTNAGLALSSEAAHKLDRGQDGREAANKAILRFKASLAIDPKFVFAQAELARAYYLLASHERVQGVDSRSPVEEGLRVVAECYRIEPDNADCKSVEAQLEAEQGEWAREHGESPLAFFGAASLLALSAARKSPDRSDLWVLVGQICLQNAEALRAAREPVRPAVEQGREAIGNALKQAPGLPRALAIDGVLSLYSATQSPEEREAVTKRARESLSQAFTANPLLKRRYEKAAREASRDLE